MSAISLGEMVTGYCGALKKTTASGGSVTAIE
jgi:hypothetical protein